MSDTATITPWAETNETKRRLLLSKWRGRVPALEKQVDELEEQIVDLQYTVDAIEPSLVEVKYWMQGIFQGGPMRDPRKILRIVERALEP